MDDSVLQEDLTIEGNIQCSNSGVLVKGKVLGDVSAPRVEVSQTGSVLGAISGKDVVIDGRLKGSVACTSLALKSGSDTDGDLKATTLSAEAGARLVGHVAVRGEPAAAMKPTGT